MTHYDTLGIDPKATPDDVKNAFRKKASKAHPDRGGSDEEMTKLNKAYEVISDPLRRHEYDKTGEDGGGSIEDMGRKVLAEVFAAALGHDDNLIITARRVLKMDRAEREKALRKATADHDRFAKRRDKIRSKAKVNMVHVLIDRALQDIKAHIASLERGMAINAEATRLIDDYESDEMVELAMPGSTFYTFSAP